MGKVPFGAELSSDQRMQIAMVTGAAERLTGTNRRPLDDAVAELRALSTDPVVYGIALGGELGELECRPDWTHRQPLIDLYRACGADEQVAEQQRVWRVAKGWTI